MKHIAYFALILLIFPFSEQLPPKKGGDELNNCEPYFDSLYQMVLSKNPTKMPEFPGGSDKLLKYLSDSILIPQQGEYVGTIRVSFIVNNQGEILYPKVFKRSVEIENAERPLRNMPRWIPAMCDSTPISMIFSFSYHIHP